MGISRLTALRIQLSDDPTVIPFEHGDKHGFAIFVTKECLPGDILISSKPVFNSAADAKEQGQRVIKLVMETDVTEPGSANVSATPT